MPLPEEYLGVSPDAFEEYMNEFDFANPPHTFPIRWRGLDINIPVFRIDVKKPRYNHKNGRILPHVLQYCAERGYDDDYFEQNDPSTVENQNIFDGFIAGDAQRAECYASFSSGLRPAYTDPLISTRNGRIINGNQRISTFRELNHGNAVEFDHLSHIYVAFLPDDGAEEELEVEYRRLERRLQEGGVLDHQKFDWIQTGLNRRRDLEDGDDVETIAAWAQVTEAEVRQSIDYIQIVDLYLEFLGTPGAYNTIRSQNQLQAVIELNTGMNRLQNIRGTDNDRLIAEFCQNSFELMDGGPEMVAGPGIGVYGHIRLLADLYCNAARNVHPRRPRRTENPRLNRRREDEQEEEVEEEPILNLEPEEGEENLAESIRNAHEVQEGRRRADNEEAYANRQLTTMITSLENIINRWGNHNLEGVPEKIREVEGLIAIIWERLGEDE